jgi:hypothetical protein
MSSLSEVIGDRLVNLRRGWKTREPGRYGYIALEVEAGSSFYVFYLLVGGAWKRLSFRKFDGDTSIYLAASSGVVVAGKLQAREFYWLQFEPRSTLVLS